MDESSRSPSVRTSRQDRVVVSILLAILALVSVALSGSHYAYWLTALVLATDIFLLALIVILAEQISSLVARERRQLSLQKLFLLTAAICIYLGLVRVACWELLSDVARRNMFDWHALIFITLLLVIFSFPVVLTLGEGLVWFLVDYQKRRRAKR